MVARRPPATSFTACGVPPRRARVGVATKRKARRHLANGLLVLATSYSRTAYRRTTIGAAAFHCRVRNGNGWGHCAIVTRTESRKLSGLSSGELKISDCRLQIEFVRRSSAFAKATA